MTKSALAVTLDQLQSDLKPLFTEARFRKHGRSYNRSTQDGLTHVIGFQMGASDPPGATYVPGLTQDLYGRFTINLGVYVPEVAREHLGREAGPVVHDYNCCIRTRLGRIDGRETWWKISASEALRGELLGLFHDQGFPFFRRYERRDQIVGEVRDGTADLELMPVPRIVGALIHFERGEQEAARSLLAAQARAATGNPGHPAYVAELARRLGLEIGS